MSTVLVGLLTQILAALAKQTTTLAGQLVSKEGPFLFGTVQGLTVLLAVVWKIITDTSLSSAEKSQLYKDSYKVLGTAFVTCGMEGITLIDEIPLLLANLAAADVQSALGLTA
jgi:hypothetical protein